MEKNVYQVPKVLYAVIILILAGMYYYADVLDVRSPEETVQTFYEAYFEQDYAVVAENISVFWAAQLLPDYSTKDSKDLLANRPAIEKDVAEFFSTVETGQKPPEGIKLQVKPEYTMTGEYSALVVYELLQDEESLTMEVAMLIKEGKDFYVINVYPLQASDLNAVKNFDIAQLDATFKQLLTAE